MPDLVDETDETIHQLNGIALKTTVYRPLLRKLTAR